MVYRVFVEKREGLAHEATSLAQDIRAFLGVNALKELRVINRYDVENITKELFEYSCKTVFSEPQLDIISDDINTDGYICFAVEALPGQFDQRADSASQCIQLINAKDRPDVKTAKVYLMKGNLTDDDVEKIKKYVINPVEAREASMEKPETLKINYNIPETVATVDGFCELDDAGLNEIVKKMGLAMDLDDLRFCRDYFRTEHRDPTITEIRMIDTYWSDHCRHTTF